MSTFTLREQKSPVRQFPPATTSTPTDTLADQSANDIPAVDGCCTTAYYGGRRLLYHRGTTGAGISATDGVSLCV